MSDRDWLSRHDPVAPPELVGSMRNAVDDNPEPTASEILGAAERLLDKVLRTDCETRASALDLLTVDALMTSALEIGAKDPKLFEGFPEGAMRRIASHAQG